MQSDNGRLNFGASLDNSQLRTDALESKNILRGIGTAAKQEGDEIETAMGKIGKSVAAVFAASQIKDFVSQVATVRGEFQQLEMAFRTMLGSGEEADALMSQLIQTAATTPFNMSEVAQSAKQLLAYGVAADEVNETLIRLGDIAAGLSIPVGDLAYLYGTTMVQGRMYTQDLNQFLNRGIPLTEELAKQFGVTKDKVKELVTEGKVGFPEVEKAIISLTSEGSKFGGLMAAQSQTITGQINTIKDTIEQMFNEIGKSSEGAINAALEGVSEVIEQWRTIAKIIVTAAVAYGTYKAALIAVTAAQKISATVTAQMALQQKLAAMQGIALTKAQTLSAAATVTMTRAWNALKLAMAANPIGLVLSVVAAAASAFLLFRDDCDEATEAAKRQKQEMEEFKKQVGDAAGQSISAYKQLQEEYTKCKDAHAKREWIKESQKRFKDLGISVTDVNTAENVFVRNTQMMMSAFKKRAEAAAWQAKLNEEYSKAVQRQMELDEKRSKITAGAVVGGTSHTTAGGYEEVGDDGKWRYTAKGAEKAAKELGDDTVLKQIQANIDKYAAKVTELQQDFNATLTEAGTTAPTTADGKSGKEAQKLADQAAERDKAIRKYAETVKEQDRQAELDIQRQNVEMMADGYEKQKETIRLHYEQLTLENEKRRKQMLDALADNKTNEWTNAHPNATKAQQEDYRKSLGDTIGTDDLTAEQQAALAAYAQLAREMYDKETAKLDETRKEREKATIQDYLKEYGDYEQKRVALAQEAEDKIAKIRKDGSITDTDKDYQTKAIQQGLEKAVKDLDFEKLKKDINWDFVFGDLENTAPEAVAAVKEQLQQFADTAKDLTPEQIKTVTEALENLRNRMDLSAPIATIRTARTEYAKAKKEYDAYAKAYKEAKTAGDTNAMTEASNGMVKSSQQMSKAANKEIKSYKEAMDVVNQYADALKEAGDTIGGTTGETLKLASAAVNCGTSMVTGVKAFQNAASKMEKAVAVLAIIEAAIKSITSLLEFFGGKADETLTDYVATMQTYIDLLSDSISDLDDSMKSAENTMADTIAYYERIQELRKQSAEAVKSESQVWLNSGAAWNSHSEGVKIRRQIEDALTSSNEDVRKFYEDGVNALNEYYKAVTGKYAEIYDFLGNIRLDDFGRMDFIWELSDDDLVKLSEDTAAMSLLGDTLSKAITEYVSKIKEARDAGEDLAESLLNVSWGDFYDDFVDVVKDMDKTSEDFANNFAEYMRNALAKNLIAEKYKTQLEALYKKAADYAQQGTLEDHIGALRDEYKQYAESAQKEIEAIDLVTGYQSDSSREASSKGIATASQESVDELNGRMTAIQGHTYSINESTKTLVQNSGLILRSVQNIDRNTEEMHGRMAAMERDIKSVRDTVGDLALKGIKIKA